MNIMIWTGGVFLLNLLLGIGFILGVYTFMSRRVGLGAVGGLGVATSLIYAQATLGEQIPGVNVSDMKLLVLAAALGATIGIIGTVLVFKPDL
jgi:hypothetical protein